jgi:transcription antitermination factor NusA-like protein
VDVWVALFHRTVLSRLGLGEYGNVARNIQATLNTASKSLNDEVPDVLPHLMKIEWARTGRAAEGFLRDGEVVVTLAHSSNRDRNLVVATLAYLGQGLLPGARLYVDRTLVRAVDFTVARGIFLANRATSAVSHLIESYVLPEIEKEPNLRADCTLMDRIEAAGLFSHVFLRQLTYLGLKTFPATPDQAIHTEIRDFANFLGQVATREKGQDVNLRFARSRIKANIMLVARAETKVWGTQAYARRVRICQDMGIEHLYICATGAQNIELAQQIATEQEQTGTLDIVQRCHFRYTAKGDDVNAICIVSALRVLTRGAPPDPSSAVYRLLEEHIPELAQAKIEVVAVARRVGVESKVAVRALADGFDPIPCCTRRAAISAMGAQLGGERLEFVRWSNDPGNLIVASLAPLSPHDVHDVLTDLDRKQAVVWVKSRTARDKALGPDGENLRCAQELTGWDIQVEAVGESVNNQPPPLVDAHA